MSIYEQLKAADVEIANHESDLYCPITAKTKEIVANYEYKAIVTTFRDQITKAGWYDIPFAYDPWWIERTGRP